MAVSPIQKALGALATSTITRTFSTTTSTNLTQKSRDFLKAVAELKASGVKLSNYQEKLVNHVENGNLQPTDRVTTSSSALIRVNQLVLNWKSNANSGLGEFGQSTKS